MLDALSLDLAPPAAALPLTHINGHTAPAPAGHPVAAEQSEPHPVAPLGGGWIAVTVVIGVMAALIALGGMTLSFRSVRAEMVPAFGPSWAWLVPIVVDLTVFVFSGVDLVLARLDMAHPLARWTVYAATAGTVALNYSAGGTTPGRIAHVLMPSIWVVFVELIRHVVRRQTHLATGNRREPIPALRWLLAPLPTFLLFRRMALWRVNSYTRALTMERTRLGAIATARAARGPLWRYRVGALLRLQIGLGEVDAAAVTAALTPATTRPDDGHRPATAAAKARPDTGRPDGHDAATTAAKARPRGGKDTATKVAKATANHPDWTAAKVAASLGIGERTARRHMTGH